MMSAISKSRWKTLEQWSPTLLYIAGFISVYFLLQNIDAIRLSYINPYITFLHPVGRILAIAGVLGLYSRLSDRVPRLSRLGAVLLAIAAVAIAFQMLTNQIVRINHDQSFYRSLRPLFISIFYINLVAYFGGFLLIGIATLQTDHYSSLLGYLLLFPAAWVALDLLLFDTRLFERTWWFSTIMGSIQALTYLAMGYILSTPDNVINKNLSSFWTWVREAT